MPTLKPWLITLTITLISSITLLHSPSGIAADFSSLNSSQKSAISGKLKPRSSYQNDLNRNKIVIMEQLFETMQHLTSIFEQHEMIDNTQLQDIAITMNKLSINIHELSQQLNTTKLDKQMLAKIKDKNDILKQNMQELLLQLNDN